MLERACAEQARWQHHRPEDLPVSVNVSAHQLMSMGFVETVATVLRTTPVAPHLLTLEITENIFVRDGERALVVLNELKDIGVLLALDDFGTGYSSLSYLKRYPVDFIKIDREFVTDLGPDRAGTTIMAALIQLAHGLDMTVVSEGVETEAQRDELSRLGCDYCQGFYFARPISRPELEAFIRPRDDGSAPRLPVPTTGASRPTER